MKKILFLALAMMCSLSNVFAQSWTSGQQVGASTFYFYNIGAQRYLNRGTQWTTHAVVDGAGMEIGVSTFQNGVSLHTGLTSGSGPYVGIRDDDEVFMDFPQTEFVCEAVSVEGYTNAYKLKCTKESTTYYLGWRGGTGESGNEVLTTTTDPSNNKNFLWLLIKPSDRTLDVTNLIKNPDFEYWSSDVYHRYDGFGGWERTYGTSNDDTYNKFIKHNSTTSFTSGIFAEAWIWPDQKLQAQKCWQNITIPTAGYYTLTVTGQAANQKEGKASTKGVKLYLKQNGNTQSTIIGAAGTQTVTMQVQAGTLELGVEIESDNDANWVAFDNVRLYYHSDTPATYTQSGNSLTFTGDGWLDKKTFNMTDYTVIVGNPSVDAEKAKVQNNGGYGAYVTDRNGFDHAFYDATTKLPLGMGTYYTIIPKSDGIFKAEVKAVDDDPDRTPELVFVDASGNIDEIIPYSEISSNFTTVDCGFVEEGKVYYLYSRTWAKLLLHKTEFTTVPEYLASLNVMGNSTQNTSGWTLIEKNDFDQYGERTGEGVWVANTNSRCTAETTGGVHGIYALTPTASGNRSVLYPFENLESRKNYVIEFDAWVETGNEPSEIALYRTEPDNDSQVSTSGYILRIVPGTGVTNVTQTEYNFYIYKDNAPQVFTAILKRAHWYHYIIYVNKDKKVGFKVIDPDTNNVIATTGEDNNKLNMYQFDGDYKALGISYYGGRSYSKARFDNIAIFSNQGSLGSVSTPQIELTGVNGTKRTVTVTGGVSDLNLPVTTYYSYITVDNSYNTTWDDILNNASWTSWDNTGAASTELPEFDPTSATTYIIRAISTAQDYATVLSDTAYLRVVAGELWTLTGGFEVVAMTQESDGYYTPTLRAYANTGILPANTNVTKTITYRPLDYGNGTERPTESLSLTWSYPENNNSVMYSEPFVVPRSSDFILHLSATGFTDGEHTRRFYKDKYKVTYSTPDFASLTDPVNDLTSFDAGFNADGVYGYSNWMRQVTLNNEQKNIWQTVAPITIPGWATLTTNDYTWNGKESGKTATLNSIICARSQGSDQSYSFRTNQSSIDNALILKVGYGLVKNSSSAWNYRCGLAHIGECNEIPEFAYDTYMGNGHNVLYAYPTPYKTGSNVPECNFSVPAYAALKQYRVFTPVEAKVVPASGLATFSSYYAVYNVSDFFMNNDELIDVYRSPNRQGWGRTYYLHVANYVKERHGFLIAANEYANKDIWTTYTDFMASNNGAGVWNGESKTVELRIIPDVPGSSTFWSGTNELLPVLVDGDFTAYNASDPTTYVEIQGSNTGTAEGRTNLILHKGTSPNYTDTDGNRIEYMNFFCLPTAASKARLLNKSAYLEMNATYQSYQNAHPTNNDIKVHLGDEDEFDDSAVAIDAVENNTDGTDDNVFYTITGQKVSNPTKGGIYIHNGKKVLVK